MTFLRRFFVGVDLYFSRVHCVRKYYLTCKNQSIWSIYQEIDKTNHNYKDYSE